MSTNKTEHLSLHQWEAGDSFLREEFNENFAKLDSARAEIQSELDKRRVPVTGTYTGSGSAVNINLGFQPRAVILSDGGSTSICVGGTNKYMVSLTATGFQVASTGWNLDYTSSGRVVHYIAI